MDRDNSASKSPHSSAAEQPSASFLVDERSKLERKIDKLREQITKSSIAREGDIEEYLKITSAMVKGSDAATNPQLARIKQHFEKKNKKYVQDTEQLQKKLEDYEQRLKELENGEDTFNQSLGKDHHSLLHGIKKTGANLKEMTGTVIAAPFDIAQRVKKNVFGSSGGGGGTFGGSADNILSPQDRGESFGHSTFYDGKNAQSERGQKTCPLADPSRIRPPEDVPRLRLNSTSSAFSVSGAQQQHAPFFLAKDDGPSTSSEILQDELKALRQKYNILQKSFETFKKETVTEIRNQQNELVNSRFKIQTLNETLNETMELHQNEVKQLKNDLSLIGARMDYQYNDRFKKIEEAVESTHNKIYRMETSWHENSERLISAASQGWNTLMLSGANIVVELLKIALYLIAVVLDTIKPLTGTRKRAGIVLCIGLATFFFWNFIAQLLSDLFSATGTAKFISPGS